MGEVGENSGKCTDTQASLSYHLQNEKRKEKKKKNACDTQHSVNLISAVISHDTQLPQGWQCNLDMLPQSQARGPISIPSTLEVSIS